MKQILRPHFSTVVDPSEYDIEYQMNFMVRMANKNKECFTEMDVGKIVGLYDAWKNMCELYEANHG